jgi:hypothetical protein
MTCLRFICSLIVASAAASLLHAQDVQFNRDIRPILSDNCYACHGPDGNQRQAGLRLDLPDEAEYVLAGGAESELVQRIFSTDPDLVMPPAGHRKKLTPGQKQQLKRWIGQGAGYQPHWAWIPPQLTDTPPTRDTGWPINFIDHYVLRQLERHDLGPSPEADPVTLVRRLYFDLTGLPPTPQQADAFAAEFVAAGNADAWEKQVDALLASPHFGERLAIYWLDLVRYADSVGYHGDQEVSVSPYRDYVIEAFNGNLPFDQFTREQLAGDLLPQPTLAQRIASGYNRLGMMSAEGGVQPEEYLTKYAADRVRTTASVWLGVTLGCAECHDHKFDPFTSRDFYSFAAFFADIKERGLYSGANQSGDWGPQVEVPDAELPALLEPLDREIQQLTASMTAPAGVLQAEQARWESDLRSGVTPWSILRPATVQTAGQTEYRILDDHSILMTGSRNDTDCYLTVAQLTAGIHTGLRLEALPDESLPGNGPGRANNGNFVVTQFVLLPDDRTAEMEMLKRRVGDWPDDLAEDVIAVDQATATAEQEGAANHPYGKWTAASVIDRDLHGPKWGWAILPDTGKAHELVVKFAEPWVLEQPRKVTLVLQQYHGAGGHVLGRFRFSVTGKGEPGVDPFRSLPGEIGELVRTDTAQRTAEQAGQLAAFYHSIAPRFQETRQQIAELQDRRQQLVARHTRTSLVTVSVPPREMRVLPRGNWMDRSGPVVMPRFPASLDVSQPSNRLTRLDLADWIVAPDHPLTARVFVNRLWKLYFGAGLSRSLDDLGSQGQWPTHPELLDRLAIEFVESCWDIKHMVRTIVTSRTYRQASRPTTQLQELDPENRWLARQARFRHDAEILRDNALAVSGLLVREIGGRSVKPYQPAGLYRHLNFPKREYRADTGRQQFRRGLYTHWQRQFLHPAMKAFDAPAREECTCQRPQSNTPIGALVLLNDPSYVEAARKLAERVLHEDAEDTASRVREMFRLALSRGPDAREVAILVDLHDRHRRHYASQTADAEALVGTGISPSPADLPVEDVAAWASVARAIMNLHEFVTRN